MVDKKQNDQKVAQDKEEAHFQFEKSSFCAQPWNKIRRKLTETIGQEVDLNHEIKKGEVKQEMKVDTSEGRSYTSSGIGP